MKNLIILIGIIFSSLLSILAGDVDYPLLIDGSGVNIRYYSNQAFAFNTLNYKTVYACIKNISSENIYFYGTEKIDSYDSIIIAKGNQDYFLFNNENKILRPNDSILVAFQFFSQYLDSVSLSGGKLQSKWRVYYRKESSLKLDSIDLLSQYYAMDKDEIIFDQLSSRSITNLKNTYKVDSDTNFNYSFFYNLTNKKIVIDSINYFIFGVNFKRLIFLNNDSVLKNDSSISFPYLLDENKHLTFKVPFQTIQPENSKCIFDVFYHFEDNTLIMTKKDTIRIIFKVLDYMSFDMITYKSLSIKLGDTVKLTSKQGYTVYNAEDKIWKLVNLSYQTTLNNAVNLELLDSLPVMISMNRITKLVKVSVIGKQIGYDTIKVTLDLEDSLGNKMQRSNVYYINVLKQTDIIPDLNKEEFLVQISPNPASDFIEISVGANGRSPLQSDLKVYNVLGEIQTTPSLRDTPPWKGRAGSFFVNH